MIWKATTLFASSAGLGLSSLVAQASNAPQSIEWVASTGAIGTCLAALAYALRLFVSGQLVSRPTEEMLHRLEELARQGEEREKHMVQLIAETQALGRKYERLAAKRDA